MSREKLYAERDYDEIEPYRMKHVMAMTAEGLHSKSDIADELAYRDKVIAEQAEQLTAAKQRIAELEKDADILQTNLDAALRDKAQLSTEMAEAKGEFEFIDKQNDGYRREIERLRAGLQKMLDWIDGDTRAINRDVGIGILSFNDIYESLDKLDEIAHEALKGAE